MEFASVEASVPVGGIQNNINSLIEENLIFLLSPTKRLTIQSLLYFSEFTVAYSSVVSYFPFCFSFADLFLFFLDFLYFDPFAIIIPLLSLLD